MPPRDKKALLDRSRLGNELAFQDLMIWSVLMDHYRLAEFFWNKGGHSIANALLCSRLFKAMSEHKVLISHGFFLETREKMARMSKKFESLASGVLELCHCEDSELAKGILKKPQSKFRLVSVYL